MTLNYTASKNIIIEAKESCRVPVPVEKCPLERLLAAEQMQASNDNNHSTFFLHFYIVNTFYNTLLNYRQFT